MCSKGKLVETKRETKGFNIFKLISFKLVKTLVTKHFLLKDF